MNADSLRQLQEKLETRRKQLLLENVPLERLYPYAVRIWHFLHSTPILTGILAMLKQRAPGIELLLMPARQGKVPNDAFQATNELDQVTYAYNALDFALRPPGGNEMSFGDVCQHIRSSKYANPWASQFVHPLFDYIIEMLDEQQLLLSQLIRYSQRAEWFKRQELYEEVKKYKEEKADVGERAEVEDLLKQDLYCYLHDQGVEFYIEPYSVHGKIDLLLDQKGSGRHYIEAKVFDNQGKNAAYLRTGFNQLFTYLTQFKAEQGYLVIYKLCEENLTFVLPHSVGSLPCVRHGGKAIFVVVIDLFPHRKPVSQRGVLKTITLTETDLIVSSPGAS
jgi:hypothetical protein